MCLKCTESYNVKSQNQYQNHHIGVQRNNIPESESNLQSQLPQRADTLQMPMTNGHSSVSRIQNK